MQMTGSNHKNMIPPQCQSLNLSILMFSSCLVWQGTFHANKNFNKQNSFPYSKKTKWAPSIFCFSCYKNYDCLKVFYVTTLITLFENTQKVSFNIANWPKMANLRSNSVTRHDAFKKDKNWWKMPKFQKFKWDIFG